MTVDECWIVETSKDGERWRFFGKAWKQPDGAILLHAAPRYVRYRRIDDEGWRDVPERAGEQPMTLLGSEEGTREELWPTDEHLGLPVVLPRGEEGRLPRFERQDDPIRWTYVLEFRGRR